MKSLDLHLWFMGCFGSILSEKSENKYYCRIISLDYFWVTF